MKRILIDTSAFSQVRRGNRPILEALQEAEEVLVSPIVIGELIAGFMSGSALAKNESYLKSFLESPRIRFLSIDQETARRYAVIHHALRQAGSPISPNDLWIAASAMQHGATVLTTDKDFEKVSQILVCCYDPVK